MATNILPGNWTKEKLRDLSPKERNRLFESVKATRIGTEEERQALAEAIIDSGPLDGRTAMTSDNPFLITMHEVINSPNGRAACLAATEQGLPALAGVEPQIVDALGEAYATTYMATVEAGGMVGSLMRELGYERVVQKPMPAGSVAKTAAVWRKLR